MRGSDERSGELFSYVDLEDRVPAQHPLRLIRARRAWRLPAFVIPSLRTAPPLECSDGTRPR
jgi:hypothetical protein